MPNYKIKNLIHSSLENVSEDDFQLWVLHANKIPPHIGVSFQRKFYSLKANGKDNGVEVRSIKNVIERKKISTLCFKLDDKELQQSIEFFFLPFEKTVPHKVTCLDPVKRIFSLQEVEKLTELLDALYQSNMILSVQGVFCEGFEGIIAYDVNDIHSRLEKLSHG